MCRPLLLVIPIISAAIGCSVARAEALSLEWKASQLYEECLTDGLTLAGDSSALVLESGTLVEDDGPAAGYSYRPNQETLDGKKQIRKLLIVDRLPARSALLLVSRGGDLKFRLNGEPLPILQTRQLGPHWQAYDFDPKRLKLGENEIVASGQGRIWIARAEEFAKGSLTRKQHPNRSAQSSDGGKTWNSDRLGDDGNADGEYCLRFWLDQTRSEGMLRTPVLDAGNLARDPIARPVRKWGQVHLDLDSSADRNSFRVQMRSGATAAVDASWTAWSDVALSKNKTAVLEDLKGRYFQLTCTVQAADPLKSPDLRGLRLESSPQFSGEWTSQLKVVREDNPPIQRSSIDFHYEDSEHPSLQKLRRDNELDQVVAGAESEFEIITRLARWSSARWPKLGHLGEAYPPWNALEILKDHADGTPVGGFCHQYNIVFLQACQSLGIPGRVVSIGPSVLTDRIRSGHETVEVWSNDYQKWVYVDGNTAWYFTHPVTNLPMSLWELRQAQWDAFETKPGPAPKLVKLADTRYEWKGLTGFPAFLELRLVPRSNFLSQESPLPLNQGMRGWFWTGYHVWSDERLPAREIYPQRVTKQANFEWPINCLYFTLEPLERPGRVRVHVETVMPNLKSLAAKFGAESEREVKSTFDWDLKPGRNRLRLTPTNQAGRRGRSNEIEIDYSEKGIRSTAVSREAVQIHVDHLLEFLDKQPREDSPVDLALVLEAGFGLALTRSQDAQPREENAAALVALGIIVGDSRLGWFAGLRPNETMRAKIARQGQRVRLGGRRDLAQHFAVSATVAAMSNELLSNTIGQFKEQIDASGGSGFSFADLLADQAGSRLGRLAMGDPKTAARVQQELSQKHGSLDYMPTIKGLPEGISADRLKSEYGGINGPRYRRLQTEIQSRLDRCRLFSAE